MNSPSTFADHFGAKPHSMPPPAVHPHRVCDSDPAKAGPATLISMSLTARPPVAKNNHSFVAPAVMPTRPRIVPIQFSLVWLVNAVLNGGMSKTLPFLFVQEASPSMPNSQLL